MGHVPAKFGHCEGVQKHRHRMVGDGGFSQTKKAVEGKASPFDLD